MKLYGLHLNNIKLIMLFSLMLCSSCIDGTSRPVTQNQMIHNDNSIRWFKRQSPGKIMGVALVIHGLNLRPDKMEPIISVLTHSGLDVLNLSLRGHGRNHSHVKGKDNGKARLETFKTVSHELWIDETYRAFLCAREKSDKEKVPLFLLGYSLGGLLGADLFSSHPDVYFDRMILLAPAFDLYAICYAANFLSFFPRLVIPSFSSRSYLSNYGTPIAAYTSLFDTIKHFEKYKSPKLNVPTIVFIDKRDELVSYRGVERMVKNMGLDQWKFHFLQKGEQGVKVKMHHLIIDEPSVGKETWNGMKNVIIKHLLP